MSDPTPATQRGERRPPFAEVFAAEARDAARELQGALTAVGIALPHLAVDPTIDPASPKQLIDLGRVRPHIACMLAALIRRGGAPTPARPPRPTLAELARRAEELARQIQRHLERPDTHVPSPPATGEALSPPPVAR